MGKLELHAISKKFKTGKVLDRISLAVEDGEIVVVFGPSGSGKTLLLRLVAGVEQPDEGRILLGGRDVTDSPPEARGVGMAFQNFALFPHMSAFDNVASALTARKAPRDVIRAKVEKVAALQNWACSSTCSARIVQWPEATHSVGQGVGGRTANSAAR